MASVRPIITKERSNIPKDARVIEAFKSALSELFFVENPSFKKNTPETKTAFHAFLKKNVSRDVWIYYPSKNLVVHCVEEDLYFKLRTARNRNIITEHEQTNFRESVVGIAGLSVGSAILSALVVSGGPKTMKIADFDVVEITNLNRIRAKLADVGESKLTVAAREVWELDPFARLGLWPAGLNKKNIEEFIAGKTRLDILVDEMDDIGLKFLARKLARLHRIPVLMATDNGHSVILDVERFDFEPKRPVFHGKVKEDDVSKAALDPKIWLKLAARIIDPHYMVPSLQDSLLQVGKNITGAPQLGPTAMMAGAAVSYAARRIVNRQPMPSGRYFFGLEEKLEPGFMSKKAVRARARKTEIFKNRLGV